MQITVLHVHVSTVGVNRKFTFHRHVMVEIHVLYCEPFPLSHYKVFILAYSCWLTQQLFQFEIAMATNSTTYKSIADTCQYM